MVSQLLLTLPGGIDLWTILYGRRRGASIVETKEFGLPRDSAVHRSRRAGAGVLTYFAGAGVCSPPVKL